MAGGGYSRAQSLRGDKDLDKLQKSEGSLVTHVTTDEETGEERVKLYTDYYSEETGKLERVLLGTSSTIDAAPAVTILDPVTGATRDKLKELAGSEPIVFFKSVTWASSDLPANLNTEWSVLVQQIPAGVNVPGIPAQTMTNITATALGFTFLSAQTYALDKDPSPTGYHVGWTVWSHSRQCVDIPTHSVVPIDMDYFVDWYYSNSYGSNELAITNATFTPSASPEPSKSIFYNVVVRKWSGTMSVFAETPDNRYVNVYDRNTDEWTGWRSLNGNNIRYYTNPLMDKTREELRLLAIDHMADLSADQAWRVIFSQVTWADTDLPHSDYDFQMRVSIDKIDNTLYEANAYYLEKRWQATWVSGTWTDWAEVQLLGPIVEVSDLDDCTYQPAATSLGYRAFVVKDYIKDGVSYKKGWYEIANLGSTIGWKYVYEDYGSYAVVLTSIDPGTLTGEDAEKFLANRTGAVFVLPVDNRNVCLSAAGSPGGSNYEYIGYYSSNATKDNWAWMRYRLTINLVSLAYTITIEPYYPNRVMSVGNGGTLNVNDQAWLQTPNAARSTVVTWKNHIMSYVYDSTNWVEYSCLTFNDDEKAYYQNICMIYKPDWSYTVYQRQDTANLSINLGTQAHGATGTFTDDQWQQIISNMNVVIIVSRTYHRCSWRNGNNMQFESGATNSNNFVYGKTFLRINSDKTWTYYSQNIPYFIDLGNKNDGDRYELQQAQYDGMIYATPQLTKFRITSKPATTDSRVIMNYIYEDRYNWYFGATFLGYDDIDHCTYYGCTVSKVTKEYWVAIRDEFLHTVSEMPTPSDIYLNKVYHYTGVDTEDYEYNKLYVCQLVDGSTTTYEWVQCSGAGGLRQISEYEAPTKEHETVQYIGEDDATHNLVKDGLYYAKDISGVLSWVPYLEYETAQIGEVRAYAGSIAPAGFLVCNGTDYAIDDYPELYAIIGRTYTPAAVAATRFCVPNLAGKFIEGGTPGTEHAAGLPLPTIASSGNHQHRWRGYYNCKGDGDRQAKSQSWINSDPNDPATGTDGAHTHTFTEDAIYKSTNTTVQPPAIEMMYIIRAKAHSQIVEITMAEVTVGEIKAFPYNATPYGYMLCDGSSYSKTDYPELFEAIQYTYGGSGDNFNVPDLRNRFVEGTDSEGVGTVLAAGLPLPTINSGGSHTHSYSAASSTRSVQINGKGDCYSSKSSYSTGSGGSHTHTVAEDTIYRSSNITVQPAAIKMEFFIRWKPALPVSTKREYVAYSTVDLIDTVSTNRGPKPTSCYQIGNVVYVSGTTDGSGNVSMSVTGLPIASKTTHGSANNNATGGTTFAKIEMAQGSDTMTITSASSPASVHYQFTYITDSYTPVAPVFDKTPIAGDLLVYDGDKWAPKSSPFSTVDISSECIIGSSIQSTDRTVRVTKCGTHVEVNLYLRTSAQMTGAVDISDSNRLISLPAKYAPLGSSGWFTLTHWSDITSTTAGTTVCVKTQTTGGRLEIFPRATVAASRTIVFNASWDCAN